MTYRLQTDRRTRGIKKEEESERANYARLPTAEAEARIIEQLIVQSRGDNIKTLKVYNLEKRIHGLTDNNPFKITSLCTAAETRPTTT
jgi:hypothetical protein